MTRSLIDIVPLPLTMTVDSKEKQGVGSFAGRIAGRVGRGVAGFGVGGIVGGIVGRTVGGRVGRGVACQFWCWWFHTNTTPVLIK